METPPGEGSSWKKRIIWLVVVAGLVWAMIGIYRFLRPEPRQLAEPVELELAAGERYELDELPMGVRYRLRACDHATELQVDIGNWTSGWVRLAVNPLDEPSRDLKVDGRPGGHLVISARTPSGRLLLFRQNQEVTCRGEDIQDLGYSARRVEQKLPPFDCEESALLRYDKETLELLEEEIEARHGAPPRPSRIAAFINRSWYRKNPGYQSTQLSDQEKECLTRLAGLAAQAPGAGALPAAGAKENEVASTPAAPASPLPAQPASSTHTPTAPQP